MTIQSPETTQTFSVYYDAQDNELNQHKMDAYALGNSILEIAKLFKQADTLLNGEQKTVDLQVTAPAREGSLAIDFAITILNSGGVDILKYLGLSSASASVIGGTALSVARQLKRKKVISIETTSGSSQAKILYNGGEIECEKTVAMLATNPDIRKSMNEVISQPFLGKNDPKFRVEINGLDVFLAEGDVVTEFTPMPKNSMSTEETQVITTNVHITQINFESKNGWRMLYDGQEKAVKMDDDAFMTRVRDSVHKFSNGDMFEVELSITHKITARSERTEYMITHVIRHRAAPERQIL